MKKPNRSEYGYSKKTGWQDERDRDLYDAALLKWDQSQPKKPMIRDFGFSPRQSSFDTVSYLQAAAIWESDFIKATEQRIAAEENLKNVRSRKPYPGNFKFKSNPIEWDKEGYEKALAEFKEQINAIAAKGIQRTRLIHPSWIEILKHFDSSNPQRSQGAFCRWANLNPASFSSWKVKPLSDDLERFILEWVSIFDHNE
jgi:hypothetical protein